MAVRLSALRVDRLLLPGRFLILISVRGRVDPRDILQLEGLGKLKNPSISSGIELATFRFVAQCLNELPYRVPPHYYYYIHQIIVNQDKEFLCSV
jgi:hypothetical protein